MLRFSSRQLTALSETLRELANLAAAALVFGQFVGQGLLSWSVVVGGTLVWVVLVGVGLLVQSE
jgi:hypothetical protein